MKRYKIKKSSPAQKKSYVIDYKAELNPRQYQAVTHLKGPQLVIAGAGSGKTRTLIYRVAFLVENNIDPQSILLLTFTRKAAQEMMRRASSILDDRCSKVAGGTFHSFANFILRKYALALRLHPNYSIVDRSDAEDIINIIRANLNLNKKERRFPRKGTLMNLISKSVNTSRDIEDLLFEDYPHYKEDCGDILKVAEHYTQFKREKMVLDYDDLLVFLKELLDTNPDICKKISSSYKYIMVDEYQDTNRLQADITVRLASEHKNVVAVGDDSQSIYSFRGANFRNIMDFPKLFPGARVTTLEQNYRSTKPILDLTNAIIQQAKEKYSKELFSDIDGIEKPVFMDAISEFEQASFVVQRILDLREEGVPLDHIAVLFRASWHANTLEVEIKNANLPYVKYGGMKFAEAAHVKDVLSYMRVLHNPFDEIAWLRLLLFLEGLGPTSARKVTQAVIQSGGKLDALTDPAFNKKKFSHALHKLHKMLTHLHASKLRPSEQMEAVIEFYDPFFEILYDNFRRRREDLNSLLRLSERYSSLEHMLTDMALEPPDTYQTEVEATGREDEKLVLSTVHSAKGLEFHSVFVIHLVDGYFPGMQSMDDEEDLEEERRLFYVAATRAQRNLYLLTPELEGRAWQSFDSGGFIFSEPSRFLTEIPEMEELLEMGVLDYDEEEDEDMDFYDDEEFDPEGIEPF
jgi:DNA helicase-2/ATP-dependent DNA helicase PcrA